MLVDKIDFVEFDRQWRGLFEDGCDYELVVNGTPVSMCEGHVDLESVAPHLGRYARHASGVALQHLHTLENEVTFSFRKKPEPLPEGWRKVDTLEHTYRREVFAQFRFVMWVTMGSPMFTECTLRATVGSDITIAYDIQDNLTPAQAAKQCEKVTADALRELIREITRD